MSSMNRVFLMGNLTRDPELRNTPGGIAVCDIGMAINEEWKTKEGDKRESTAFVDVVAWGRQAETCSEYLHKGSCVMVEGKLQYDEGESKDGSKRNKIRVRADRVQFIGGKTEHETNEE